MTYEKKSFFLLGAIALVVILLNVGIAIQIGDVDGMFFSNIEALAQLENQGSTSGPTGPTLSAPVECTSTTTTTTNTNNGSTSDWNVNGGVNIGGGIWGANAGGGYNSGNNSSSGTSTTTTTTSTWSAMKYYCPSQNKSSCQPYDPC